MKKIFILLVVFLISVNISFAIEEVLLNVDDNSIPQKGINKVFEEDDEYTLREKIQDIKSKEVKDTNSSSYLLDGILTKHFESGPIETMHFFGYYRAAADMNLSENGDTIYDFT